MLQIIFRKIHFILLLIQILNCCTYYMLLTMLMHNSSIASLSCFEFSIFFFIFQNDYVRKNKWLLIEKPNKKFFLFSYKKVHLPCKTKWPNQIYSSNKVFCLKKLNKAFYDFIYQKQIRLYDPFFNETKDIVRYLCTLYVRSLF